METKFAPGPWQADWQTSGACLITSSDGEIIVATVDPSLDPEGTEADIHLIAAAPDMYEALVYVRENLGDPVPVGRRHVARKVDAALAKARGES